MRKYQLANTEAQLRNAQEEIKRQLEENGELKSCMFCIHNLSGDESISFYTAFKYTWPGMSPMFLSGCKEEHSNKYLNSNSSLMKLAVRKLSH